MTSRERIQRVLRRETVDRVPIDIGGLNVTGMHAYEYIEVGNHLGLDLEYPKITDPLMMLVRIEEPLRRRLRSDTIPLENMTERWGLLHKNWQPWQADSDGYPVLMPDGAAFETTEEGGIYLLAPGGERVAYMPAGGLYFDPIGNTALSNEFIKADPDTCRDKLPLYTEEELSTLARRGEFFYQFTDYAVIGGFRKGQLGHNWTFAGHSMTDWFCLLHLEPEYTREMLEMVTERALENLRLYLQAVGDFIDVIFISSTDYGNQRNSTINPNVFHERYRPCYQKMNDYVHAHSQAKTFFHSCGSIRNLLDDFIDAGVDIINPIQASAEGMEVGKLKQDFGDRLIFWGGGVDSQTTLQSGTTQEVSAQVRERVHVLGAGGGFVFAADHNIQHTVPPDNVLTMFDTAYEAGKKLYQR